MYICQQIYATVFHKFCITVQVLYNNIFMYIYINGRVISLYMWALKQNGFESIIKHVSKWQDHQFSQFHCYSVVKQMNILCGKQYCYVTTTLSMCGYVVCVITYVSTSMLHCSTRPVYCNTFMCMYILHICQQIYATLFHKSCFTICEVCIHSIPLLLR